MKFKKLSLAVGAMTLLPMSVVVSCNKKTDEKKTIEELSKKVSAIDNAIAEKEKAIADLNAKTLEVEKLSKNIENSNKNVSKLTSDLEISNNKINDLTTELDEAKKTLKLEEAKVVIRTKDLEIAENKVLNLTIELRDEKAKVEKLNEELATEKAKVEKLNEELATEKAKVVELTENLEKAKATAEKNYENLANNIGRTKPALVTSEESMNTINSLISLVKAEKTSNPSITKNELIVKITNHLMDKPYVANRLIGSSNVQEQLVADIEQLDCFTFFDYVNALLDATSFDTFLTNLKATRYNESKVEYVNRKHFFTDWEHGTAIVKNLVAEKESEADFADKVVKLTFNRNGKKQADGTLKPILAGVPIVENREITYLKVDAVTDEFMKANFQDGDLIMLAAPASLNDWLDVTHCGYLVFKDGKAMYRNASSKKSLMKVADVELVEYLTDRNFNSKEGKPYETPRVPGILVYRTL